MNENWRKSAHGNSNGVCAEIASWRKSSWSFSNGGCVEAGTGENVVGVRDTKQAHLGDARTVLVFSSAAWQQFTASIKG